MKRLVRALCGVGFGLLAASAAGAVTIDFENLSSGETTSPVVYPEAVFTSSSGRFFINGAGVSNDLCPFTGSCAASLTVAFTSAVSNLSFTAVGDDAVSQISYSIVANGVTSTGQFTQDGVFSSQDLFSFGALSGITSLSLTSNDGAGVAYDNFNFDAAAVPEPATWALMIGGFGMVGGAMRRCAGRTTASFA